MNGVTRRFDIALYQDIISCNFSREPTCIAIHMKKKLAKMWPRLLLNPNKVILNQILNVCCLLYKLILFLAKRTEVY